MKNVSLKYDLPQFNHCTFPEIFLLSSADFFQNYFFFSKNSSRNTIGASNGLDPDQDRRSVGPDLGPNCLQEYSADEKSRR